MLGYPGPQPSCPPSPRPPPPSGGPNLLGVGVRGCTWAPPMVRTSLVPSIKVAFTLDVVVVHMHFYDFWRAMCTMHSMMLCLIPLHSTALFPAPHVAEPPPTCGAFPHEIGSPLCFAFCSFFRFKFCCVLNMGKIVLCLQWS